MYSAGFFPFPTPEEKWAYWNRMVLCNRYEPIPRPAVYADLLTLLRGWNTPGVFKVPFWQMTLRRPAARYAWLDTSPDPLPAALAPLSIHIRADIGATLAALRAP